MLSWLSFELCGLSAGGLVVPGYLAFFLDQPERLLTTFVLAGAVTGVVRLLARYLVLYGRRRFMVVVLLGFTAGACWRSAIVAVPEAAEFYVVGLIVPGLLAAEMDRQGVLPTTVVTLVVTAIVRLGLELYR